MESGLVSDGENVQRLLVSIYYRDQRLGSRVARTVSLSISHTSYYLLFKFIVAQLRRNRKQNYRDYLRINSKIYLAVKLNSAHSLISKQVDLGPDYKDVN